MGRFGIYENINQKYCEEHHLNFEKTENLNISRGIDSMTLKNAKGDTMLIIEGYEENSIVLQDTDLTAKELK